VDLAIQLYEQSLSVARIGRHLGVDGNTIWRALRARGVRMRDAQGVSASERVRQEVGAQVVRLSNGQFLTGVDRLVMG
jgi:IS30 family transposase